MQGWHCGFLLSCYLGSHYRLFTWEMQSCSWNSLVTPTATLPSWNYWNWMSVYWLHNLGKHCTVMQQNIRGKCSSCCPICKRYGDQVHMTFSSFIRNERSSSNTQLYTGSSLLRGAQSPAFLYHWISWTEPSLNLQYCRAKDSTKAPTQHQSQKRLNLVTEYVAWTLYTN